MPGFTSALTTDTESLLGEASDIATRRFGAAAVADIPRLVTDIAIVMSNLIVADATQKKG